MIPDINTRQHFDDYLQDAIAKVTKLTQGEPGDKTLFAVLRQLKAIEQWTAGGANMTSEQKKKIVMGVQASREMANFETEQDLVLALDSYIESQMPSAPEP